MSRLDDLVKITLVSEQVLDLDPFGSKEIKEEIPPKRTRQSPDRKENENGEKNLPEALGLVGKVRRRKAAPVPLDLDAYQQAEASIRRTHPLRGKENYGSLREKDAGAKPFDGGLLTARRGRDRRRSGHGITSSWSSDPAR